MEDSREERVQHPSHYMWLKDVCGIEVIDITRHLDFDLGNVVKYVLRAGHKKEAGLSDVDKAIEDLLKAQFYLDDEIKLLERKRDKQDTSTPTEKEPNISASTETEEEGMTYNELYDRAIESEIRTINYTRDDIAD